MAGIILFEDERATDLLPLTYWRAVFDLRVGRCTLREFASQALGVEVRGHWTRELVAEVTRRRHLLPVNDPIEEGFWLINGRWIPQGPLPDTDGPVVGTIDDDEIAFIRCDRALATSLTAAALLDPAQREKALKSVMHVRTEGVMIRHPWDVIANLTAQFQREWDAVGQAGVRKPDPGVLTEGENPVHIAESASIHSTAVLDARNGAIFIDEEVSVGPYSVLEGPLFVGAGSRVHAHARIHGGNAIGPACRVGGEVEGCVLQAHVNKQHLGFLGHAIVGEWVNIGAGACNSDLKNTYGEVRVDIAGKRIDTGLTFFGGALGDHAKIGINASLPTGAWVGFAAQCAAGYTAPTFVPSFTWIDTDGLGRGDPDRLLVTAARMMGRRGVTIRPAEEELFREIFRTAASREG